VCILKNKSLELKIKRAILTHRGQGTGKSCGTTDQHFTIFHQLNTVDFVNEAAKIAVNDRRLA